MEWLNKLSPQQRAIADKVAAEADRQGVPRELALAAAMQESSFKPQAKSKTGPVGVMMLGRAAAKEQGVNRYNLDQNIRGGVGYLKQNLAQQGGDPQRALIAYHDGPNSDFFKGGSMSPAAYNHLQKVKSYGGFQGDLIPMATKPENTNTGVSIADIEPIPDIPMFSQPQETPGFGNAADIGSAGAGALTGMFTAPSVRKQAEINRSLIQAANASNVPINEANAANMQRYNDELAQRKRLLDAITEAQKSGGVPGYVESQLQGGAEDVVSRDPRVISNRTAQAVIPEYESGNTRAQAVNRGELVSDPNRFAGLSVPRTELAPPGPTPQQLVAQQLGPEPTRPVPHQLNVPQVQPIRSMAAQGAATGALTGFNALKAAEGIHSDDPVKALLGSVGAVSGGLANQSRNPRTAMLAGTLSAVSGIVGHGLDGIRGQKKPQDKSVLNKAEGGLARLPKFAGKGESLVRGGKALAKKAEDVIGFSPAEKQPDAWKLGDQKPGKLSDWAQNYLGHWYVPTQADRMGGVGGSSYSANQLVLPQYANRAWGSGKKGTATSIANLAKDPRFGGPENQIFAPILGKKNMHESNQIVFNTLVDEFYKNPEKLTPELRSKINAYIQSGGVTPKGKLKFDPIPGFDIADRGMVEELGKTFDKRKAIAQHAFGGEGISKTKAQIIPYQQILDEMSDPMTHGAPSFSMGPRAFRLTGEVESVPRPDLNLAYPNQLFGQDLNVTYTPVPGELSLMDFGNQWRKDMGKTEAKPSGALHQPGYFEYTLGYKLPGASERTYPRQLMSEEWVKELQRSGFADGGLVNLQSGGNPKTALLKTLGNKVLPLVERDANLQKFLLPSQEKRRMYHGTTGDINKFNPNNNITFLTPEPTFANSFAAKSFDPVESQSRGPNPVVKPGANVMPVHVQAENIFNPYKPSHLDSLYDKLMQDYGQDLGSYNVRQMVHDVKNPYDNWQAIENDMVQKAIKELGHDSFVSTEAGVQNLGMYNPRKIKSAIGNEGTYNTNELDINKAKGGLVHLQSGGSPKKQIGMRLATSAYDMLGLTPESVAAWRKANAKPYKQQQDPVLAQATDAYLNKQISQADYLRIMNERRPIRPLTAVPAAHSNVDIVSALDPNKVEKGILGLNLQVPEGTRVGNRLDIPAYERYGTYVDTMHDAAGKPIGYGHTGRLTDVQFKSSPTKAARVGLGTKEQGLTPMAEAEGQGKSPFAMMVGNQVNTSDDEVRRMLQEYLRDPEWHQIGMNPYRASQFYDKADMMPVWSAKEKIQAGPLVLARDIEKSDWTDPRLMTDFGVNYKEGGLVNLQAGGNPKAAALKAFADPAAKYLKDWSWKPMPEVAGKLDLRTVPDYIQGGYGQFMKDQARRAAAGALNARDLIKAYTITQSSIGRGGLSHATATKAGLKLPNTGGEVRPEGAFAEWLGSPMGQRYLDTASAGQADPRALAEIQQQFAPFGKQNDLIEKMQYAAQTMPNLSQNLNQAVLGDKDAYRNWAEQMKGVAGAKSGFIGSMLGRGDLPTFDARQINLHTANQAPVGISSIMNRGKGLGGREAVDRLAARQEALGLELDPSLDPFYQHLTHHAVWDKVGNNQTTHDDLVKAMRNYKAGGQVGLYANIHAKRERIKQGSGEKMRKPGSEGAPTADAFRESAKTAKRK